MSESADLQDNECHAGAKGARFIAGTYKLPERLYLIGNHRVM